MSGLVGYMLLFLVIGSGFVFIHLMIGKLVRPSKPDPEKKTIYECGEPTIGSAWVQFDLRFYVVALLFVIFDVEVAFFFPWAVVFGQSNSLAHMQAPTNDAERLAYIRQLKSLVPPQMQTDDQKAITALDGEGKKWEETRTDWADRINAQLEKDRAAAKSNAWLAFWDILVFFGVLLVGFAYLWARGDLNWVRSLASEEGEAAAAPEAPKPADKVLVGAGR
jgi:NADH-quinone oxidoreductase subunit A